MYVVGFAGVSGVGKTTLVERVIPVLKARGLRVSVIKHAHQGFDIDRPGKDSWRHREAGAHEVLVASARRLALLRELPAEGLPTIAELLAELQACDWVLVEGFKHGELPKIEVWRAARGEPPRYAVDANVVAVATDDPTALPVPPAVPVLPMDDPVAVASYLLDTAERYEYSRR